MPCGRYLLTLKSNNPTAQSPGGAFGRDAAIKIDLDRPGGATLCNSDFQDRWITIDDQEITETAGVTVTQAGLDATHGTFTGEGFTPYNFDTNADEKLLVWIDGAVDTDSSVLVQVNLNANFADVASAASGITIDGATVVVDGNVLKIISKSTGKNSGAVVTTDFLGANSGTNALALFGISGACYDCQYTGTDARAVITGTLKTTLNGLVSKVFVTASRSRRFVTTTDIVIGGTTVSAANWGIHGFQIFNNEEIGEAPDSVDKNLLALINYKFIIDLKCAAQGIQIANGEYKNNVAQKNGGALNTDVGRKNSMFEVKKTTFKSNKGMSMKNSCFYISFCKLTSFLSLSHTH